MKKESTKNIYKQMQRFADVTKQMFLQKNTQRVNRCLQVAESLFINGNAETKNAVSNVYLFSISSFMEAYNCEVKILLPKLLLKEYYSQVIKSGV